MRDLNAHFRMHGLSGMLSFVGVRLLDDNVFEFQSVASCSWFISFIFFPEQAALERVVFVLFSFVHFS